ncbi:MAG: protein kinase [Acidobacteriota bacterium]|nr:protein kinase [Acidobacteriota bacterium]
MKSIAPNTLIQNRYLIVHLIGKGGMGEVYLAVDQRLGSAIALKRTFFSDDVLLGNAFEREARTLARLRHPVLPKVSDHFTDEGTQYLVMEHISGEDMSKRLEAADKPFPLSWVLFWADQLLDALTYLHTHEPPIIHRDIKPQNLKLTDENHIVLLDFGLSKNSAGETRATTTGSIVGYTPHYAPMEQIRGTGTDARSDIYSLSATLYQIMTGTIPPDALTRADSLINGMPDPVPPISELNKEISKGISDVIIKGMSISQEQRYKTAREMQKALRDAYSQMQNATTAGTVEYAAGSEPAILQAQQQTEVPPVASLVSQPLPSVSNPSAAGKSEMDFDATLRYDEPAEKSKPKQADIKTEVILGSDSSVIADAIAETDQNSFGQQEHFEEKETNQTGNYEESKFFSDEDLKQSPGYSPDATVPLMSFDKDANGISTGFDAPADSGKTSTFTSPEASAPGKSVVAAAPAKKKSSKTAAIVGGIAALLILAVGAAAVGWYVMRDNSGTSEVTPTPTPEASVSVAPTVEPTLEIVNQTNVNADTNELTNGAITTNGNDSTNVKTGGTPTATATVAPTRTIQPTPTRAVSTPRPTPIVNIEPSRPTPKPSVKKTPPTIAP